MKTVIGTDEFGVFTIRKFFALLFILFATLHYAPAQTAVKLVNGSYQTIKTDSLGIGKARLLGANFKAADNKLYPIYKSDKGKYFIIRTSLKTGNNYKQYLAIQE